MDNVHWTWSFSLFSICLGFIAAIVMMMMMMLMIIMMTLMMMMMMMTMMMMMKYRKVMNAPVGGGR